MIIFNYLMNFIHNEIIMQKSSSYMTFGLPVLLGIVALGFVGYSASVYALPFDPPIELVNPHTLGTTGFGNSVEVHGNNIIVGSPFDSEGGITNAGVAFVYDTNGQLIHTLEKSSPVANEFFGTSVALNEQYALIGVPFENTNGGAGYLFDLSTGQLVHTLVPSEVGFLYGLKVAIDDNHAVLASNAFNKAKLYDIQTGNHILDFEGASTVPPNNFSLSSDVDIEGNLLVLSSVSDRSSGPAFLNIFDITTCDVNNDNLCDATEALYVISAPTTGNEFGNSISISGDRVIVGDSSGDVSNTVSSFVHVYDLTDGSLIDTYHNLQPPTPQAGNFGSSVSLDGDKLLVNSAHPGGPHLAPALDIASGFVDVNAGTLHGTSYSASAALDGFNIVIGYPSSSDPNGGKVFLIKEFPNTDPVITSTPPTTAIVDQLYQYDAEAFDPDPFSQIVDPDFSLLSGPSGMTLLPPASDGIFEWTPTAGDVGTHSVTIQVDDHILGFDTQIFEILVSSDNADSDNDGLDDSVDSNPNAFTATTTGAWTSPDTWEGGIVPAESDNKEVLSGVIVSVGQLDNSGTIDNFGTIAPVQGFNPGPPPSFDDVGPFIDNSGVINNHCGEISAETFTGNPVNEHLCAVTAFYPPDGALIGTSQTTLAPSFGWTPPTNQIPVLYELQILDSSDNTVHQSQTSQTTTSSVPITHDSFTWTVKTLDIDSSALPYPSVLVSSPDLDSSTLAGFTISNCDAVPASECIFPPKDSPTVTKTASPSVIDLAGTGGQEVTTVTIEIEGFNAHFGDNYVFLLDSSSSLDPAEFDFEKLLIKKIAKNYPSINDKMSIVRFGNDAQEFYSFANNQDKSLLSTFIDTIPHQGSDGSTVLTNTKDAVLKGIDIFASHNDPTQQRIMVLITDGNPTPPDDQSVCEPSLKPALDDNEIQMVVIGVGDDWTIEYFSCLVDDENSDIHHIPFGADVNSLFNTLPLPGTNISMRETTHSYIIDETNFSIPPDSIETLTDGQTSMVWDNIPSQVGNMDDFLESDEKFTVSFDVKSNLAGNNIEVNDLSQSLLTILQGTFADAFFPLSAQSLITVNGDANTYCDGLTIQALIASGNYNIIDNRDGSLDGSEIIGTNDADLILLSDNGNTAKAKKGDDCVIGGTGDDTILGNAGLDQIFGNDGNDLLIGGKDGDTIFGGEGRDFIRGNQGDDTLSGDGGNDVIRAAGGLDILSGGDGDDLMFGGKDADTMNGDAGSDVMFGRDGIDTINGGDDNDFIFGNQGDDLLNGNDGNDFIQGQKGDNDNIDGGAGTDMCFDMKNLLSSISCEVTDIS